MIDMDLSISTTLLAILIVWAGLIAIACAGILLVAVWRNDPVLAPPEYVPLTDGIEFFWPRSPLTPPARPFDHGRDRWDW